MRVVKHAFLSLRRKPTKAIMIFIILFVVFGLVFTGIIIQNSITSSKEFVRKELGAVVEMKPDYIKAMTDQLDNKDYEQLSLSATLAMEIAKDADVKQVYINETTAVSSEKLKSAQKEGGNVSLVAVGSTSASAVAFMLTGGNTFVPIEFDYGSLVLSEGRYRTAEDQGKDTLLISEEFASTNSLAIGDSVELTSSVDNQIYTFEVLGIYQGSSSNGVDQMYTSLESAKKLAGTVSDDQHASSINFALKDPLEVDSFIERHKVEIPTAYIYLDAKDTEYKNLTRPLDLIATITTILLWVVFVAGAIIMLAIITIFVRDRKFEIGLLLSSGESKLKILSQFVFEILIVSIIAFALAAGISNVSSGYAAKWIVNNQLVEEKTASSNQMISIGMGQEMGTEVNISDVAKEFNVSVDRGVILQLILLSFGLVIFSTGAPLMIILSYKPRESLQD